MHGVGSKDAFRREVMKWQNTITDAQNKIEPAEKIDCNFFSVEPNLETQTPYNSMSEIMEVIDNLKNDVQTLNEKFDEHCLSIDNVKKDVQALNEKIDDFGNRCELLNNILLDKLSAIETIQDYVTDVANRLSKNLSNETPKSIELESKELSPKIVENIDSSNLQLSKSDDLIYQPYIMINKEIISHPNNRTTLNDKQLVMHIEIDVDKLLLDDTKSSDDRRSLDGKIDTSQLSINIFGNEKDDKINNYKIEGNIEMMYRITRDETFIGIINGYVTKIETYMICCMQLSPLPTSEDGRLIINWFHLF
jgi:gas vesicle protein